MKSSSSKNTGNVKNSKQGKTIRKKTRRDFSDSNYDIDYISNVIESMDIPSRHSGMMDELFEDLNDWE